jgi:hypothetical protein
VEDLGEVSGVVEQRGGRGRRMTSTAQPRAESTADAITATFYSTFTRHAFATLRQRRSKLENKTVNEKSMLHCRIVRSPNEMRGLPPFFKNQASSFKSCRPLVSASLR